MHFFSGVSDHRFEVWVSLPEIVSPHHTNPSWCSQCRFFVYPRSCWCSSPTINYQLRFKPSEG